MPANKLWMFYKEPYLLIIFPTEWEWTKLLTLHKIVELKQELDHSISKEKPPE
jgi:hypothetical protein